MEIINILKEASFSSINIIWKMAYIILPLMIIFEILYTTGLLDKFAEKIKFITKWYELPKKAIFPLVSGVFIGLAVGSGILLNYRSKNILSHRDFNIVTSIIGLFHAIVEDTLIFVVIGASFFWVFGVKLLVAIFLIKALLLIPKAFPKLDMFK